MLKKTFLSIAVATTALSLAACNDTETVVDPVEPEVTTVEEEVVVADPIVETDPMTTTDTMATQSITELAADNPNLSTLVAALQAADLDETLAATGTNYTVFAPTNDAFDALLNTLGVTQDELLADNDMLTQVLTYHVVPNAVVRSNEIPYGSNIETVNGQGFTIDNNNVITGANGGTANIVQPDITATNGVVHVIDAVLLPQ